MCCVNIVIIFFFFACRFTVCIGTFYAFVWIAIASAHVGPRLTFFFAFFPQVTVFERTFQLAAMKRSVAGIAIVLVAFGTTSWHNYSCDDTRHSLVELRTFFFFFFLIFVSQQAYGARTRICFSTPRI